MIDDADAERLAYVAAQFAAQLRDDDPEATARWLCAELDGVERWQLLFMLAAMVPVDQTPAQLLAWFWDAKHQAQARRIIDAMYRDRVRPDVVEQRRQQLLDAMGEEAA